MKSVYLYTVSSARMTATKSIKRTYSWAVYDRILSYNNDLLNLPEARWPVREAVVDLVYENL